jgi:hypothetical protein
MKTFFKICTIGIVGPITATIATAFGLVLFVLFAVGLILGRLVF